MGRRVRINDAQKKINSKEKKRKRDIKRDREIERG